MNRKPRESGSGAPHRQEEAAVVEPMTTESVAANDANLDALTKATEAFWSGFTAMSQEMMQFASERMRENIALSGSVLQCGDPGDAFRIECEYARAATQQYLSEATKLMSLATETSQRSWEPIEALTRQAFKRLGPQ